MCSRASRPTYPDMFLTCVRGHSQPYHNSRHWSGDPYPDLRTGRSRMASKLLIVFTQILARRCFRKPVKRNEYSPDESGILSPHEVEITDRRSNLGAKAGCQGVQSMVITRIRDLPFVLTRHSICYPWVLRSRSNVRSFWGPLQRWSRSRNGELTLTDRSTAYPNYISILY